jgi:hypothetical protein
MEEYIQKIREYYEIKSDGSLEFVPSGPENKNNLSAKDERLRIAISFLQTIKPEI